MDFLASINMSPLLISLKTAIIATVVAFFGGIACARWAMKLKPLSKSILDGILNLPLVLPPTVAGFLLLLIFSLKRPLGIYLWEHYQLKVVLSWPGCVLAATVVAFPLMYRNARAAFEQVDVNYIYAGRTLGLSEWTIFRKVVIPVAGPGIASGTILTFARALGEYGATSMLAGNILGKTRTMAVAIAAEVSADSVKVINKNLFVNTDMFDCKVTVAKNGKVIRKASIATAVAPLSEEVYALPLAKEEKPGEYAVTVSFHLKEDKVWAEAGHEVAFGQYVYKVEEPKKVCPEGVEVIRSTHNIGVRGAHFEVLFSVLNGGLVSYKYAGKEMIEAIPKPNFWRAPTDNDCGNLMGMRYGQWKLASMYLSHKDFRKGPYGPGNMPKVEVNEKTVKVTYTYLMPTTPLSECSLSYEVFGDGRVKTTLTYDPVKELGDMPEFGVIFKFNADYDRVEWYGLGEAETYSDRKKGAKLGIYANKVADNIARYMVPQECGAKEEVRWAKVTDRKGRGMLFEMDENNGPMMFSALPYTPHEMENAMHPYELPEVHYTVVRVAKDQMGIGGDDSWGARTHEEYLLETDKKMEFSFVFKGL